MRHKSIRFATKTNSFYNFEVNLFLNVLNNVLYCTVFYQDPSAMFFDCTKDEATLLENVLSVCGNRCTEPYTMDTILHLRID